MNRSFRRLASLVLVVALIAAACSERTTYEDDVRAAVELTGTDSTAFVYTDERPDRTTTVQGVIEDDFRLKASVQIDGSPAYEQVVRDDTLAIRFVDPTAIRAVLSPAAADADLDTELDDATALDVLRSGRSVRDDTAAPLVTAASTQLEDLGRDPVLDAFSALDYVRRATEEAVSVDRYSGDSLDPTYPTSEDVFPVPEDGSGVERFDLRRPDLPAVSSNTGDATGVALPNVRNFRKMAIYVEDGKVIQVIERIEATGKRLEQFVDYIRNALTVFNFGDEFVEEFEIAIANARSDEEIAEILFAGLNTTLLSLGQEPVQRRVMTLSFPDTAVGEIALPTDDVVIGSLDALAASAAGQSALLRAEEEGRDVDLTGDDAGGADPAGETGEAGDAPAAEPAGTPTTVPE